MNPNQRVTSQRITKLFRDSYLSPELPRYISHSNQQENHQDPQRGHIGILSALPKIKSHDGKHGAVVRVKQDRGRELAQGNDADVDPTGHEARHQQRKDNLLEGLKPRAAARQRGLFQLFVDLDHRGRSRPDAVRHELRDVGEQQHPDRPVDRDRKRQVNPDQADPQDNARHGDRDESHVVEKNPAGELGLHRDPRDHGREQHDERGRAHREIKTILERSERERVAHDVLIIGERQLPYQLPRRHSVVRNERRPEQDEDGQNHRQEKDRKRAGAGHVLPGTEIDHPGAVTFSRHGGVFLLPPGDFLINEDTDGADDQQRHRVGARQTEIRRELVDGEKDLGGKNGYPRGNADQGRNLKGLHPANEHDEQGAEHRRAHQRERDPPERLKGAGPRAQRGLLQGGIHVAECRRHQQEDQRIEVDRLGPDHPPHRVDVERRGLQAQDSLYREIDQSYFRAQEQNPRDGAEDAGNDERDQRHDDEHFFERRIGPLADPGEVGPDHEGDDRAPEGKLERVPEKEIKIPVEVGLDVVLDGIGGAGLPYGRATHAPIEEHHQRNPGEIENEQRAADEDQGLGVAETDHLRRSGTGF